MKFPQMEPVLLVLVVAILTLARITQSQTDLPQIQSYIASQGLGDRLTNVQPVSIDSASGVSDAEFQAAQRSKWDLPPKDLFDSRDVVIDTADLSSMEVGSGRSGKNIGFVKASGISFTVNGQPYTCAGTNAYYMSRLDFLSTDEVLSQIKQQVDEGANVLRVFIAYDFNSEGTQPSLGTYNEEALARVDYVMAASAYYGMRIIAVVANYWPFVGGMQAYVDEWSQSVGRPAGQPIELFYTEPDIRNFYKAWLKKIITRTNTITGLPYKDDPTIMAWELANEPHTTDSYEIRLGITPGTILCAWVKEMSSYILTLDSNHMVTTGEEGYRSEGNSDAQYGWLNNGLKGADFTCNVCNTDISFATIHTYPDSWAMSDYQWLGENYIRDRADVAHSCGKPIILEEYGMGTSRNYLPSREPLFDYLHDEANAAGYACTLVWAVAPYTATGDLLGSNDGQGYVFSYDGDGAASIKAQYAYSNGNQNGGSGGPEPGDGVVLLPEGTPPPSLLPSTSSVLSGCPECTNIPPDGTVFILSDGGDICFQLAEDGRCSDSDLATSCNLSCGRCDCGFEEGSSTAPTTSPPASPTTSDPLPAPAPAPTPPSAPTPTPTSGGTSTTPNGCGDCDNLLPGADAIYSDDICDRLASGGQCNDADLLDRCNLSCGRCSCDAAATGCSDDPPDGSATCAQQAKWGKCSENYMQSPICDKSCGRCS